MPFAKRAVSPVRIGNKRISEADKFDLTVVCNNALVCILEQLASLSLHAESLFVELEQECQIVVNRTERIKAKVRKIESYVDQLDFRAVPIPVGDLEKFDKIKNHFKVNYEVEQNLLTPESRPECVRDLYKFADPSPIKIIRQCNHYRRDGKTGSQIFSLQPVFKDTRDVNKEVHAYSEKTSDGNEKGAGLGFRRIRERPRSLTAVKEIQINDESSTLERRSRAVAPAGNFIAINTSGTSFTRMCQHRETLHSASNECVDTDSRRSRRRQKRRQTVSGVPQQVMDDLSEAIYAREREARSLSRERLERPRSVAYLDRYAPRDERFYKSREELRKERIERDSSMEREKTELARSCSLRRSMRSLFKGADKEKSKSMDLWAGGRPRSPGPPVVDLRQVRRSRSLPRSLKSVKNSVAKLVKSRSASTEGRLDSDSPHKSNEKLVADEFVTHVAKRKPRGLLRSMTKRMSKSQSSVNTVSRGPMPKSVSESQCLRPNSLDFRFDPRQRGPIAVHSPTTPQSAESVPCTAAEHKAIGIKQRLNIPPGNAWKAFGGIRYRNRMQCKPRERQSSSGNWSGTDSLRYSGSSTTSRTSYDSAVSFNLDASVTERHTFTGRDDLSTISSSNANTDGVSTINEEETVQEDSDSTLNGSVVDVGQNSKLTADDWLTKAKPIVKRKRRRSRKDRAEKTNGKGSPSIGANCLTMSNIKVHENAFRSALKIKLTDDESSVYSVDQDGFYTSMHLDSGLKRSTNDLIEEMPHDSSSISGVKSNRKIPPPPPPRTTSCLSKNAPLRQSQVSLNSLNDQLDNLRLSNLSLNSIRSNDSKISSVSQNTSNARLVGSKRDSLLSETDSEAIYVRVKDKTNISSAGYPSLCSVTPLNSDEECDVSGLSQNKRTPASEKPSENSQHKPLSQVNISPATPMNKASQVPPQRNEPRQNSFKMMMNSMLDSDNAIPMNKMPQVPLHIHRNEPRQNSFKMMMNSMLDSDIKTPVNKMPQAPLQRNEPRQNSFKMMMNSMLDSENTKQVLVTPVNKPLPPQVSTSTPVHKGTHAPFNRTDPRQNSYRLMMNYMLESSYERSDKSMDDSVISSDFDLAGMELIDTSVYSTWPRNPKNKVPTMADAEKQEDNSTGPSTGKTGPSAISEERNANQQNTEDFKSSDNKENEDKGVLPEGVSNKPKDSDIKSVRKKKKKSNVSNTSTWPKKKSSSSDHNSSVDDSSIEMTSKGYTDPSDKLSWTSTFPRRKKDQDPPLNITVPSSLPVPNSGNVSQSPSETSWPQAAHARLIISSPVAGQAAYVDNPHKRSLCSPVSDREFEFFTFNQATTRPHQQSAPFRVVKSNTMFDFSTSPVRNSQFNTSNVATSPESRPLSQPLYPSIGAMKHSITFPYAGEKPDNNNKTWYDGAREKENLARKSPSKVAKDISVNEHMLSRTGYPFADFLEDSFLNTLECSDGKRLSRFSLISTNSSSSSGSGRKSLHFGSELKNSESSLNKLDTTSVGSGQTNCSDKSSLSRTSGGSLLAAFKTKRSVDNRPQSLGLKDKLKLKKSTKSGSNIQLPPMPSNKSAEKGKSEVNKADANSSQGPVQSPTQLKRSSAVLEDDFDVFTLPNSQWENVGSDILDCSFGSDAGSKRKCVSRSSVSSRGSPSKTQILRRNRLRSASKTALQTVKANPASCEVIVMPPSPSPEVFTFNSSHMSEMSFSKAIMEYAPKKMSLDGSPPKTPQKINFGFSAQKTPQKIDICGSPEKIYINTKPPTTCGKENIAESGKQITQSISEKKSNKSALRQTQASVSPVIPISDGVQNLRITSPEQNKKNATPHSVSAKPSLSLMNKPPSGKSNQTAKPDSHGLSEQKTAPMRVRKEQAEVEQNKTTMNKDQQSQTKTKVTTVPKNSESKLPLKVNTLENYSIPRSPEKKACQSTERKGGVEDGKTARKPTPQKLKLPKLREWKPCDSKKTSKTNARNSDKRKSNQDEKGDDKSVKTKGLSSKQDATVNRDSARFRSVSTVDLKSCDSGAALQPNLTVHGSTTDISKRNTATVIDLQKTGSMTKSLSNLSCLSLLRDASIIYDSEMSLAKSTDSLASNSSTQAGKIRSAKMAFLSQQNDAEMKSKNSLDERFSRYTLGKNRRSGSNSSVSKLGLKSASCTSINDSTLKIYSTNNNKHNEVTKGHKNEVSSPKGKFEEVSGPKNTVV